MAKETAYFRGAGGSIWPMLLPLPEVYGAQLAKGELVRVEAEFVPGDGPDVPGHYVETGPWLGGPTAVHGAAPVEPDARDAEIARLQAELTALRAGEAGAPAGGEQIKRPAAGAAKPEWVAYAVAMGMPTTEAEAATKVELVELFGEK